MRIVFASTTESDELGGAASLETIAYRPSGVSATPKGLIPTKVLAPAGAAIRPLGRIAVVG